MKSKTKPKKIKEYCTKHSLFHGQKYLSCTTKPKKKIEKIMFEVYNPSIHFDIQITLIQITLKNKINELVEAVNKLNEHKD